MNADLIFFGLLLMAILVAIALVDARSQRIPDALNLGLLLAGLGFQLKTNSEFLLQQAVFAAGVGLLFLIVREAHRSMTGIVGLGLGDVKMAGAGAIWFAPVAFPIFLFAASLCALAFVAFCAAFGRPVGRTQRVPFGPFLAIGIAVAFGLEHL